MGPCWSHHEGKKDYLGHAYVYEGACVYVHVNIGVVTLMSMCDFSSNNGTRPIAKE